MSRVAQKDKPWSELMWRPPTSLPAEYRRVLVEGMRQYPPLWSEDASRWTDEHLRAAWEQQLGKKPQIKVERFILPVKFNADALRILRTVGLAHGTAAWHEKRWYMPNGGTTANKIADTSSKEYWIEHVAEAFYKHVGLLPEVENDDMARGTLREPAIREAVARRNGELILEPDMLRSPLSSLYLASADGIGVESGRLYEFKSPRGYKLKEDGTKEWETWDKTKDERMKQRYKHQVQAGMWALGVREGELDYMRFVADGAPGDELRAVPIKFDPAWSKRNGPRLWSYLHLVYLGRERLGTTWARMQEIKEAMRATQFILLESDPALARDNKALENQMVAAHADFMRDHYGIDTQAERLAFLQANALDWVYDAKAQ